MIKLLRTIAVTLSMYSRIPMPHFEWKDEDMRYSMSVFPWVGAVIGLIFTGIFRLSGLYGIPSAAAALLMTAVPVAVTGGFHVDGFMDVQDAFSSYADREKKLGILSDPHIGAFAVIRLGLLALIYIASLMIIIESDDAAGLVITASSGFFMARALSAIGVLTLRSAKHEGMLCYEASCAGTGRVVNIIICSVWILAAATVMIWADVRAGIAGTAAAGLSYAWYRYRSYKELGGITGDTAGWFVVICEAAVTAAAALAALLP